MTRDEFALLLLADRRIHVDAEHGLIYTLGRVDRGSILKGHPQKGYLTHCVMYQGQRRTLLAHRIVWVSVNGPVPTDLQLDHANRVKADNRISNLRLTTAFGNSLNSPSTKFSIGKARAIRARYAAGETQDEIAVDCGVGQAYISMIVLNKIWKEENWARLPSLLL